MRRAGFTLMELLVIVGIVLVLLAILFPVLAAARRRSQATQTRAQLGRLRGAVEEYRTLFDTYPGPVSEADLCASTTYTGAQNLLAGLTRKVRPVATPAYVQASADTWVERDYTTGPERFGRPMTTPLLVPAPGETAPASTILPALSELGVFVDRFPTGLPILYYKGNAGAKTVVANSPADGVAAFYLASNAGFTNQTLLHAADGGVFPQNLTQAGLLQVVTNADGSAMGGFVLISAGADRTFGPDRLGKVDDIVEAGGH